MRLIDADAFTRDIQREFEDASSITKMFVNAMIDAIKHTPTIEAEPVRHGQWIPRKITASSACSECRRVFTDETPFCPNCGAKIDGGAFDA